LLSDKEAAEQGKEDEADLKGEAQARRPPVAISDNVAYLWGQCFYKVKRLSHSLYDPFYVSGLLQFGLQPVTKELLHDGRRK
jgi:hypothetical protein